MRTYAPATVDHVLDELLSEPSMARGVVHHERIPARAARTAPLPAWLDPRISRGLEQRGISSLYTHQAEAIEAVHAGRDVVVVTPTASGKSLCYTVPVLQALAQDRSARALFLFPTKALGQDQVAEFSTLARLSELDVSTATYDGDTPAPIRAAIRTAGQVVVTNPDMLHAAILPHHTKWFQLFEQLQVIVVDELHTYRGVFGSHVANVLRRLLRLCAHYGSKPLIVCCSATIGNPAGAGHDADRPDSPARRSQRRPGRRAPPAAGRSSAARRGHRCPRLGPYPGQPMEPAVPASRPPDDRLRPLADGRRAAPDGSSRVAPGARRTAFTRARLSRRLSAHRAPVDRTGPAQRRGARRRRHECARAGRRHRSPGRRGDRGLPGLGGRQPGSRSAGPDAAAGSAWPC